MDIHKMKTKESIWDVIKYVNDLFDKAIKINASDIHIEPTEEYVIIRLRVDGSFLLSDKINIEEYSSFCTRLKVMAKIKIDENKKPQDWKIAYNSEKNKEKIDIRLSTLPTNYWEKVVMRVLRQDTSLLAIEKLWFLTPNQKRIIEALKSKYGIVLIAWPTWSGKSTSLFWILNNFDPLEYNISTLEDPIEYNIPFVNQSQIKPEIWYTFASWLRSLVRQDPDIIMVWEIRDLETSKLSIEAALTWHLVLSTIHTNSAASTIQRLINMDIEPFLISSALKMVISQRLMKKICPECIEKANLDDNVKNKIKKHLWEIIDESEIENLHFYKWKWCEKCNHTWYKWRTWAHEVLIMSEEIEHAILAQETAQKIEHLAKLEWMTTIVQDALLKAAMWKTTVEEALKLI